MALPKKIENSALLAIRNFLESPVSAHLDDSALSTLNSETYLLPLVNIDWWERQIRLMLWAEPKTPAAKTWKFWVKRTPERQLSYLDLCSPDGFIRERALLEIPESTSNAFSYILHLEGSTIGSLKFGLLRGNEFRILSAYLALNLWQTHYGQLFPMASRGEEWMLMTDWHLST